MSDRKLKAVESLGSTEEPAVTTFHLRGREYTVTEMLAEDYEEALRAAAVEDSDKTDMLVFDKLMAVGSVAIDGEPVSLERWNKLPHPIASRVMDEVKRVHWLNLETDEEIEARKAAAAAKAKADKEKPEKSDVPNS